MVENRTRVVMNAQRSKSTFRLIPESDTNRDDQLYKEVPGFDGRVRLLFFLFFFFLSYLEMHGPIE